MEMSAGGVFEFLFKYRAVVFDRGVFSLGTTWPVWVLLVVSLGIGLITLLSYTNVRGRIGKFDRTALVGMRFAILAVIIFCLSRPLLVIATVIPQENFLGILFDDSRSMQIADLDGEPRSAFLERHFGQADSELRTALSDRFKLRFFGFSETVERVAGADALRFGGSRTFLGPALERVFGELSAVPLAGLVVFTDGADNSDTQLTETILQLRGRRVPVHAVGLGSERFERDIEISRVEAPGTVLQGSSVSVDVTIFHSGFAGDSVQLDVEDGGRIINSQSVHLAREGEATTTRVHFTAADIGPRLLRFQIRPSPGEQVIENNSREALVVVKGSPRRILYVEGEPRFEIGHLRRAIADDENVEVVYLIVTAENKYYRLDVANENEVVSGFPRTREELFQYSGLVLGSVEASHFTHDQLQMIVDFVGERGGGLLTLGGRRSFAEGGYLGTPVENVLPVSLEQPRDTDSVLTATLVKVHLTPFGRSHPITQLAATPEESEARWSELPELSTVNPIFDAKPGASTLLSGIADGFDRQIVLASQRYGRGRSAAFSVQDSWIWQMHAEISVEDQTHETFWRQLLRWLVNSAPDQVNAVVSKDRLGVQEPVTITTEVVDSAYVSVNNVQVNAHVTTPSGEELLLPLEWTVERDGEYQARFEPGERGLYDIRVEAERNGEHLGNATTHIQVAEPVDEFFDSEMQAPLLRRIAEETGGGFYTSETVDALPEDVRFTESGSTVYEELDLWDMPIVFFLLMTLIAGEWSYRKWRGLV